MVEAASGSSSEASASSISGNQRLLHRGPGAAASSCDQEMKPRHLWRFATRHSATSESLATCERSRVPAPRGRVEHWRAGPLDFLWLCPATTLNRSWYGGCVRYNLDAEGVACRDRRLRINNAWPRAHRIRASYHGRYSRLFLNTLVVSSILTT